MISQTVSLEVIVTATETEALLLETNMIKRLKPRFNVLMRDDKSFPYIAIRTDHPVAALQKHRGAKSFKGKFYGPFASAGAVNQHAEHAAKSVSAALVLRQHILRAHASVHAAPDQALRRAVRGLGRRGGICGPGARRRRFPGGPHCRSAGPPRR